MWMTRPTPPTYAKWHAVNSEVGWQRPLPGGAVALVPLGQPAGVVSQPGSDHPFQGMDPSDPKTYVRPYRPAPGMIAYLNFDGAQPNVTQTTGGPPRRWGRGPRGRG
jgi:hypothetical protein